MNIFQGCVPNQPILKSEPSEYIPKIRLTDKYLPNDNQWNSEQDISRLTNESPQKSWDYVPVKCKIWILYKYLDTFKNILGTVFGFQSFIISNDFLTEGSLSTSMHLMLMSFTINLFMFVWCILCQYAIIGGLYREWYWYIHNACIFQFGASMFAFYFSFMMSIYEFYKEKIPTFIAFIYLYGVTCAAVIVLFHLYIEYNKWFDRSSNRSKNIMLNMQILN